MKPLQALARVRKAGYEVVARDELERYLRAVNYYQYHTCPYGELPQKVRQLVAELEGQKLVSARLAARLIEADRQWVGFDGKGD